MRNWYVLLMCFLVIAGCKKERTQEAVCVSENVVKQMNTYNPDESQIAPLLRTFIKEQKAYRQHQADLKTLVVTDDRAVDLALFQMEAVLNFMHGNILDTALKYEKTESMQFTVGTKGYDAEGKVMLDGADMMDKYALAETFAMDNDFGKEMMSMDFVLKNIENGLAYFEVNKNIGEEKHLVLGTDHFTPAQSPVMACRPYLCSGAPSLKGYELINNRIFTNTNSALTCSNGESLVFYNLHSFHLSGKPNEGNLYDPITGNWYNYVDKIYYKKQLGASPDQCMDYNELNKYLDGARFVYNHELDIQRYYFGSNCLIVSFNLHGGEGWLQLGNPDTYTVHHWIELEAANYACFTPY